MSSSKKSRIVKFKTSDDKTFEVEEAVAVQFETIKSMIDYVCANDCTIPLPNVNAKTLAMVVEWCKKHADERNQLMEVDVDEAPAAVLYDLLAAATYLRVKNLIHGVSQRVSERLIEIGKQSEEEDVCKIINIKSDFPPQVEEELRKLRRTLGALSDVLVLFVSSGLL